MPSWITPASRTTGVQATTSSAATSGGLITSWATTRHSARSASTFSDWRKALPPTRGALGSGGTCASRKRFAARRSSRTSRRQITAASTTIGSPMPTADKAAPSTSRSTAGTARIAIGSVTAR
ncbi:MAG TPA: hypothetical protein VN213_21245 [Solirubrobacteraceae bacterium]|nr:hypothetical protein [Solirubrobacteraceae bacterium]